MTSKERVLRNYTFQPVDRFTIDFCASTDVYARLCEYYGAKTDLELSQCPRTSSHSERDAPNSSNGRAYRGERG